MLLTKNRILLVVFSTTLGGCITSDGTVFPITVVDNTKDTVISNYMPRQLMDKDPFGNAFKKANKLCQRFDKEAVLKKKNLNKAIINYTYTLIYDCK